MKNPSTYLFLPTDKASNIALLNNELLYSEIESKSEGKSICQHLYILSDDEIKEGDWIIDNRPEKENGEDANLIIKAESNIEVHPLCKKIIATTNPDLWKRINNEDGSLYKQEVPSISQYT